VRTFDAAPNNSRPKKVLDLSSFERTQYAPQAEPGPLAFAKLIAFRPWNGALLDPLLEERIACLRISSSATLATWQKSADQTLFDVRVQMRLEFRPVAG